MNSNSKNFDVLKDMTCEVHQGKKVTSVMFEQSKSISLQQCFQCDQCCINNPKLQRMTLENLINYCNKKKEQNFNERLYILLEIYNKSIDNLKTLTQNLEKEVLNLIKQVDKYLDQKLFDIYKLVASQELYMHINHQRLTDDNEELFKKQINEDFNKQILQKIEPFKDFNEYPKFEKEFDNFLLKLNEKKQQEQGFQTVGYPITQPEVCYSIDFNNTNNLMISGCNNNIRVWEFNAGKMNQIHNIEAHSSQVTYLLFSKIQNNFISGSSEGSLKCWSIKNNKQLESSDTYEYHPKGISCIITNKSENLLFTGDMEQNILIWEANFSLKQLQFLTSLVSHQNRIFGLSLNESETILASCSYDKQIIIWRKISNQQWQFERNINQYYSEFGIRIKFISNDRLIWIPGSRESQDCLFDIQLDDKNVLKQLQKQELSKCQNTIDGVYFPIVCLKVNGQNIIIVKHKLTIYLFKVTKKGDLSIVALWIQKSADFFGAVTNDGQYMVIWEQSEQRYQIYKIVI